MFIRSVHMFKSFFNHFIVAVWFLVEEMSVYDVKKFIFLGRRAGRGNCLSIMYLCLSLLLSNSSKKYRGDD